MNIPNKHQGEKEIKFAYIDSSASAKKFADDIKGCKIAGVDIEGSSLHSFGDNVSLIQVAAAGDIYIIDPLNNEDISQAVAALEQVALIFHGGDYDLRMLLSDFDFNPRQAVWDTMLGAELLGVEAIGLAAILKDFLGVEISKAGQKSNWTKRPLSESQIQYACTDVLYLEQLFEYLYKRLEEKDRLEWWRQCCERLVSRSKELKDNSDRDLWRIKGSKDFEPSQLRYLQFIWQWRDDLARAQNKPVFKIASNNFILNLAVWLDANEGKNPRKFRDYPKNCRGKSFEQLLEFIKKAKSIDKKHFPQPIKRQRKFYKQPDKELVEQIKDAVTDKAQQLELKPQLLVTRARIEAIAREMPQNEQQLSEVGDLMDWQKELTAPAILDVLSRFKD